MTLTNGTPATGAGTWGAPLQLIETVESFRTAMAAERAAGATVGLVATMGALHAGHRSLIERAAAECAAVAVSVFVNPLQFGDAADLGRYPRHLAADGDEAAAAGAGYLFAPPVDEMLPAGMATTVRVGGVSEDMEGAARPGHFEGVATVVARLLALTGACRAYFGEKDHQQFLVVRRLVADLGLPVEVVACPTVRATDGLALSSRNARLSPAERASAPVLFRALTAGAAMVAAGTRDAAAVEAAVAEVMAAEPLARLDYARAVVEDEGWRVYVAAWIGATRLIDNLAVGDIPKAMAHQ
ncbi:MAG: pantoate--beta-alanine ligase [Acidimicrobiales bacterium]